MDEQNAPRLESAPSAHFEEDRYYRPNDPALSIIATRGTLATWRADLAIGNSGIAFCISVPISTHGSMRTWWSRR